MVPEEPRTPLAPETYRHLVDTIPDCLLVHRNATVLFVNKAVQTKLGYAPEDVVGKSVFTFVPTDDHKRQVMENMNRRLRGEDVPDYEVDVVDSRGHIHTVIVRGVATVFNDEPAFQVVLIDITERKMMEEELLRARKLESIGLLAGGIAHDFNNILTGIIAGITMAKLQVAKGSEVHSFLEEVEQASFKAGELTRQLLTFSKGGSPVRQRVNLKELIRDAVSFSLRGSSADCTLDIAPDLLSVEVDTGQMSQVFSNLAINADQAMPEGGRLRVRATNVAYGDPGVPEGVRVERAPENLPLEQGLYVRVTVADTGVGIAPHDLHRIFDPYFTTKERGTGLGLATVYSIVKKHSGHLSVESRLGHGTVFSIYLPATVRAPSPTDDGEQPQRVDGKRILIMDDDQTIRSMLSKLLADVGYRVETVDEGARAISVYGAAINAQDPFAVVLMDLTIPGGMGGKEAARRILEVDPKARLVVFSGYSNDPVLANSRDHGFMGVIKKPFDVAVLMDMLQSIATAPER